MMSGHGGNPIFFNKKIKIGRPEHSLTTPTPPPPPPTPLRPITSYFCFTPSPPQIARHMCITPKDPVYLPLTVGIVFCVVVKNAV